MRICYVVHSLHHFAAPYVDYFGARGHEIHVVSFSHAPIANAVNHHPTARDFGDDAFGNLDYVRAIPAVRAAARPGFPSAPRDPAVADREAPRPCRSR